jgi:hypothetical protein
MLHHLSYFNKYLVHKRKPDLFKDNNKTESTNSDKENANVLADFFTSVFTIEGDEEMHDIEKVDVPPLAIFPTTELRTNPL